ncbi:MAG: hypothetical protein HYX68_27940 [Planctomycetes bacterium]|nr:hypothetical protein [Planctomycetota bacterium]
MSVHEAMWLSFEDEVYEALNKALTSGCFPFTGIAKVLRGPQYAGLTPGSMVKIEVALEARGQGDSEPFLIWLWECKHKNHRKVEIDDVRELQCNLQEIGLGRTVGSLMTTIGFQQGAIELAKKLGISLYMLKKTPVPHRNHQHGAEETRRRMIVAERWVDFSGTEAKGESFETAAMADFGLLLARRMTSAGADDPWESIKMRLGARPIHAGGLHFKRDELHERR